MGHFIENFSEVVQGTLVAGLGGALSGGIGSAMQGGSFWEGAAWGAGSAAIVYLPYAAAGAIRNHPNDSHSGFRITGEPTSEQIAKFNKMVDELNCDKETAEMLRVAKNRGIRVSLADRGGGLYFNGKVCIDLNTTMTTKDGVNLSPNVVAGHEFGHALYPRFGKLLPDNIYYNSKWSTVEEWRNIRGWEHRYFDSHGLGRPRMMNPPINADIY